MKTQPNPTEVHTQYDYEFIKKQLQNYLNPGSVEEDTPAAGASVETKPESSSPQKTDFTLETATAGNKDTVSKFMIYLMSNGKEKRSSRKSDRCSP